MVKKQNELNEENYENDGFFMNRNRINMTTKLGYLERNPARYAAER